MIFFRRYRAIRPTRIKGALVVGAMPLRLLYKPVLAMNKREILKSALLLLQHPVQLRQRCHAKVASHVLLAGACATKFCAEITLHAKLAEGHHPPTPELPFKSITSSHGHREGKPLNQTYKAYVSSATEARVLPNWAVKRTPTRAKASPLSWPLLVPFSRCAPYGAAYLGRWAAWSQLTVVEFTTIL